VKLANLRLFRNGNFVVVVVAVLCSAVLAWIVLARSGGDHHTNGGSSQPNSRQPTIAAPPSSSLSTLEPTKTLLDERAKAFVAAYFSLTPPDGAGDVNQTIELSTKNSKQAVRPLATTRFLETASFGYALYGSPLDIQFAEAQVSITAKPLTGLTDAHINSRKGRAQGTVMVHFVKTDASGTYDLGDKPQLLNFVKQGDTWFVDSAPLT
jgi:hypothetical protein